MRAVLPWKSRIALPFLVADGEPRAMMARLLDLVEQGDGIILVADMALSIVRRQQLVGAEAKLAGALARTEEDRWRKEGPVQFLLLPQPVERVAGRRSLGLDEVGKIG